MLYNRFINPKCSYEVGTWIKIADVTGQYLKKCHKALWIVIWQNNNNILNLIPNLKYCIKFATSPHKCWRQILQNCFIRELYNAYECFMNAFKNEALYVFGLKKKKKKKTRCYILNMKPFKLYKVLF